MRILKQLLIVSLGGLFAGGAVAVFVFAPRYQTVFSHEHKKQLFAMQAVDTMKYSRDISGQVLDNPAAFRKMIDKQMMLIKNVGATHVAIATPYDERFIPVLSLWVSSARAHGLSVWFRGNFSGWEGWFGVPKIDRAEHKRLLVAFIKKQSSLFRDGDFFSPCPECENGGQGDPRRTGDREGYNKFLIEEREIALREFKALGKSLEVYTTMNGDIARDIITPSVAKSLGGTVLIDHYVSSAERFGNDVRTIAKKLDAKVGLGELGAPIPDLNGNMTPLAQANFVRALLDTLYVQNESIPMVSYWTLTGGSTAIVNDDGTPRPAYFVLKDYYTAPYVYGTIMDSLGAPLNDITVTVASTTYSVKTEGGFYQLFLPSGYRTIVVEDRAVYPGVTFSLPLDIGTSTQRNVYLEPAHPSLWYKIRAFFYGKKT